MSELHFVWDASKATDNVRNHGVTFDEAKTVMYDPARVELFDAEHSGNENRWQVVGLSERLRLLMVVTTEQHEAIRIISARRANRSEEARYVAQGQR